MSITDFVKASRGLQISVFAMPLCGRFFEHKSAIPFPPMGDDSPFWCFFALLGIAASVVIPYFMPKSTRKSFVVVLLFVAFLASIYFYRRLEKLYIVPLSDGSTFVIKGSVRNPKLSEPYTSMDDQNLIEHSGARDADLQHAYTWESIEDNRTDIFTTYMFSLIAFQLMLGYAALIGKATVISQDATTESAVL